MLERFLEKVCQKPLERRIRDSEGIAKKAMAQVAEKSQVLDEIELGLAATGLGKLVRKCFRVGFGIN
jgi:predicted transcriptional regulator